MTDTVIARLDQVAVVWLTTALARSMYRTHVINQEQA